MCTISQRQHSHPYITSRHVVCEVCCCAAICAMLALCRLYWPCILIKGCNINSTYTYVMHMALMGEYVLSLPCMVGFCRGRCTSVGSCWPFFLLPSHLIVCTCCLVLGLFWWCVSVCATVTQPSAASQVASAKHASWQQLVSSDFMSVLILCLSTGQTSGAGKTLLLISSTIF